jgi:hypothetical protein
MVWRRSKLKDENLTHLPRGNPHSNNSTLSLPEKQEMRGDKQESER